MERRHPAERRKGAAKPTTGKNRGPELWIKLTLPGVGQIGPGKIELLRRIEDERSISAAARSMGMSYRRAWLLVDELNRLFNAPVVVTHVGGSMRGGASVAPLGAKLIRSYDEIVAQANHVCADLLRDLAAQ
ncbi:MAG TPA: transcriptional regulator [Gammaproteobacteria bacterium]|nr:transcriptional regulator [Gammaproteobacteria bacterium]